jgi:hypothetical protein
MDATVGRAVVGRLARSLLVSVATVAVAFSGAAWAQSGPASNPGDRPGSKPAGAGPSAKPAEAPKPTKATFSLSNVLTPGAPVAATIARTFKGKGSVTIAGKRDEHTIDAADDVQLVDTFLEAKDGGWKVRRHVVKSFSSDGTKTTDDELNGIDFLITFTASRQISVEAQGGRLARKSTLTKMQAAAVIPCFFLELPSSASVGDECTVNLSALVPLLLNLSGAADDNEAKFKVVHFDEATKVATLEGRAKLKERADAAAFDLPEGSAVDGTFEVDATMSLEVDTAAHRVVKATLAGPLTYSGKLKAMPVSTAGDVKVVATTSTTDAEKLAAAPPTFRDVPREIGQTGASLTLPSHWFDLPPAAGWNAMFESSLDASKNASFVQVRVTERTGDFASTVKELETGLKSDVPGVAAPKDVACKLGLGKQWTFEKQGTKTTVEVYPAGDKAALVWRLQSTTARFPAALAEFEKARATITFTAKH